MFAVSVEGLPLTIRATFFFRSRSFPLLRPQTPHALLESEDLLHSFLTRPPPETHPQAHLFLVVSYGKTPFLESQSRCQYCHGSHRAETFLVSVVSLPIHHLNLNKTSCHEKSRIQYLSSSWSDMFFFSSFLHS